jgi:lathosterol oxidase
LFIFWRYDAWKGSRMIDIAFETLSMFGVIAGLFMAAYLLAAAAGYGLIRLLAGTRFARRRLQAHPGAEQMWRELGCSSVTILIVSLLLTAACHDGGGGRWSQMYFNVADHGWSYLAGSVVVIGTVHDCYVWLLRQALGRSAVLRRLHRRWRGDPNPTLFASFAAHPMHALIGAAWCVPLAFTLPLHPIALGVYIILLSLRNAISHLGYAYYRPAATHCAARTEAGRLRYDYAHERINHRH